MDVLSGNDCVDLVKAMQKKLDAYRDKLSALDAATGDGDHGINITTALAEAVHDVEQLDDPNPADVFKTTGMALINKMGGASGAIFGSFFRNGSKAIKGEDHINLPKLLAFFEAGLAAVQKRGNAQLGDKTLVDALSPAIQALQYGAQHEMSIAEALSAAADASHVGAENTAKLVAKFGRAKFLGERSLGHQDPGAVSMSLILKAWSEQLNPEGSQT